MAVKKNFLRLLILMNFTCIAQDNFKSANQDEIYRKIDNMLDSLESTLELQNTAIALLQKQLYSNQKKHKISLCVFSAVVASVMTLLILKNQANRLNRLGLF